MKKHEGELGVIAHQWFEVMRKCGDEVRALLHDGCPVACLGDASFGYVNIFTSHVNVGVLSRRSAAGSGPSIARHRQVHAPCEAETGTFTNAAALSKLIDTAYWDIKSRVENG
jgi:hypothetical protein